MANSPNIGVYKGLSGWITPKIGFLFANSKTDPICIQRSTQGLEVVCNPVAAERMSVNIMCNCDVVMHK